jgi:hypothetical protein
LEKQGHHGQGAALAVAPCSVPLSRGIGQGRNAPRQSCRHSERIVSHAYTYPRLRWADVRRELKSLGVDASREDHGSGSYEYRVTLADLPPARAEAIASYTDDLEDALGTGRLMGAQRKAEQEKAAREAAAPPCPRGLPRADLWQGPARPTAVRY